MFKGKNHWNFMKTVRWTEFILSNKRLIDSESNSMRLNRLQDEGFGWTSYHTYSEIYDWIDSLLLQYPSVLTDYTVGTSFEGRRIRAVRLSRKTVRNGSVPNGLKYEI